MDNLDQLSSLLAPILNNPEAMSEIAQAASQLGLGDMLNSAFAADNSSENTDNEENSSDSFSQENPSETAFPTDTGDIIGKILPVLSSAGKQDDSARLLSALRPFLHGDRVKRLENAERILKLMSMVNLLHKQGII